VSSSGLENAKQLESNYKQGQIKEMSPDLWKAKKVIDSTLHPDTGQPVFLPFRMSCFVISNLVVTAGMLTPNLSVRHPSFAQLRLTHNTDSRNSWLADNKPISQRRHQLCQRQQVLPSFHPHTSHLIHPRRICLLHRSTRSQLSCSASPQPQPYSPHHAFAPRPIRRRR